MISLVSYFSHSLAPYVLVDLLLCLMGNNKKEIHIPGCWEGGKNIIFNPGNEHAG